MRKKVTYGYQNVLPEEKRGLILSHFEAIADRYDLADTLLSFGLHFFWRRRALQILNLKHGDKVLDLCSGTGDFALSAARSVGAGGITVACDISRQMMLAGQKKACRHGLHKSIEWIQGDAEEMGFSDDSFDAVVVGYGIRNFVFLEHGLEEIFRVLKSGGKFMAMEFSIPKNVWLKRLYGYYSFKVLPRAGKMITGTSEPFNYLAESIRVFPPPEKVLDLLSAAGMKNPGFVLLNNGLAVLFYAEKP